MSCKRNVQIMLNFVQCSMKSYRLNVPTPWVHIENPCLAMGNPRYMYLCDNFFFFKCTPACTVIENVQFWLNFVVVY